MEAEARQELRRQFQTRVGGLIAKSMATLDASAHELPPPGAPGDRQGAQAWRLQLPGDAAAGAAGTLRRLLSEFSDELQAWDRDVLGAFGLAATCTCAAVPLPPGQPPAWTLQVSLRDKRPEVICLELSDSEDEAPEADPATPRGARRAPSPAPLLSSEPPPAPARPPPPAPPAGADLDGAGLHDSGPPPMPLQLHVHEVPLGFDVDDVDLDDCGGDGGQPMEEDEGGGGAVAADWASSPPPSDEAPPPLNDHQQQQQSLPSLPWVKPEGRAPGAWVKPEHESEPVSVKPEVKEEEGAQQQQQQQRWAGLIKPEGAGIKPEGGVAVKPEVGVKRQRDDDDGEEGQLPALQLPSLLPLQRLQQRRRAPVASAQDDEEEGAAGGGGGGAGGAAGLEARREGLVDPLAVRGGGFVARGGRERVMRQAALRASAHLKEQDPDDDAEEEGRRVPKEEGSDQEESEGEQDQDQQDEEEDGDVEEAAAEEERPRQRARAPGGLGGVRGRLLAAALGLRKRADDEEEQRDVEGVARREPREGSGGEEAERGVGGGASAASAPRRGKRLDKVRGTTCHFCRQKTVCGVEGCPRCEREGARASDKAWELPLCLGKSYCRRCVGTQQCSNGFFCQGCLKVRFGLELEEVNKAVPAWQEGEEGEEGWVCPHCYELEHPDEGWICNSSICLPRRGILCTDQAGAMARAAGLQSVAHLMQVRLRERARRGGESVQELLAGLQLHASTQARAAADAKRRAAAAAAAAAGAAASASQPQEGEAGAAEEEQESEEQESEGEEIEGEDSDQEENEGEEAEAARPAKQRKPWLVDILAEDRARQAPRAKKAPRRGARAGGAGGAAAAAAMEGAPEEEVPPQEEEEQHDV